MLFIIASIQRSGYNPDLRRRLILASVGFLAVLPIAGEDLKAYPDGPGKDVFVRVCTRCHEAANTTKLRLTKRQWQGKVYAQADRGAEASGEELDQIVDYLAHNFGPQK
jgi:hypothetical protein